MPANYPKVILKPQRERSIKARHPWIFSGAIQKIEGEAVNGAVVEVFSSSQEFLAVGHYNDQSIAVKLFSFSRIKDETLFWDSALREAYHLRETLGLTSNRRTNAYRLVNAEGDGLPGLVIDIYHQTAVLQCQSEGMRRWRAEIAGALQRFYGEKIVGIFDKSTRTAAVEEDNAGEEKTAGGSYLWGRAGEKRIIENELCFACDWENGQKTGFYLDQRDNRKLLESLAASRSVLNAFCYTGAFSVYALRGGATQVCSVDASKGSVETVSQNIELNCKDAEHREVVADCFAFLQNFDAKYDLVVLDPPAFVKHQKALSRGLRGYETINYHAIKQIAEGGLIFTFSCSELVNRETFRQTVFNAASRAGRPVRILHELSQAPCHPVNLFHPEGGYLKGLVLAVG